jgi:cytochrome c553
MRTPSKTSLVATGVLAAGVLISAADPPSWAYVRNAPNQHVEPDDGKPRSVPGSPRTYMLKEIRNVFSPPDWHPDDHPPMPEIVGKGRGGEVRACGYCHLPNGIGKPENAAVSGLPVAYFKQQIADFKSGARRSSVQDIPPQALMLKTALAVSDADVDIAAEYFAKLPPTRPGWITVKEVTTVPTMTTAGSIVVPDGSGRTEPIGQRVLETSTNFHLTELRDAHTGYIAYVPVGSIKKGQELAATGGSGKTMQCNICHGPDLNGLGNVPRIAGLSPTYVVRQLFDMQAGTRNGPGAALMKSAVAKLTEEDMVSLAAYLGSLAP